MEFRPIASKADHDRALAAIETDFETEPESGSPEADRFNALAALIDSYERKPWAIEG